MEKKGKLLKDVLNLFHTYKSMVDGEGESLFCQHIFNLHKKHYTSDVHTVLHKKSWVCKHMTCKDCCRDAVDMLSKMGFNINTTECTVSHIQLDTIFISFLLVQ